MINPAIIAKFVPLTAVRCESPVFLISNVCQSDCKEVSPKTIPGINAPASFVGINLRKPVLIDEATFKNTFWLIVM